MSAHGSRAVRRHHEAWRRREKFAVGHVAFEVEESQGAATFCIRVRHDAHMPKVPPPLCSGLIEPGMARELRKLAQKVEEIEARVRAGREAT